MTQRIKGYLVLYVSPAGAPVERWYPTKEMADRVAQETRERLQVPVQVIAER